MKRVSKSADLTRLWRLDRASVWHPYTRRSALEAGPLPVITRGKGIYLYGADGRRYVDAVSSWWCCNLGHSHPGLVRAIQRQAGQLQHSILGNLSHPPAIELAARLSALLGGGRRVLFASDGASAVEAALKIAVQHGHARGEPRRTAFASLRGGYHGDTLGAVSVGYVPAFHRPVRPLLFRCHRAESPCCGTCARGPDFRRCGTACFESMRRIIERHGSSLAAVIVEPLCQGAAGMRIYPPAYLRLLAECCRTHGVLLIIDEIAMGFGRTGRMFAFQHAGIDPDIVCLGKGLSAGYLPISATVVRESIYDAFDDGPPDHTLYHGHTFTGNPIAAAAAVEVLKVYDDQRIVTRARSGGLVLARALAGLRGAPGVRDVRCLGMIGAVELESAAAARSVGERLRYEGFLVRPLGPVIYLMLPLVATDAQIRSAAGALTRAVAPG